MFRHKTPDRTAHGPQTRPAPAILVLLLALLVTACAAEPSPAPTAAAPAPGSQEEATPVAEPTNTPEAAEPTNTPETEEPGQPEATATPAPSEPEPVAEPFQPDQVTLQLETVVEGLRQPLFATHAGDGSGRLFIVEKAGTIRILVDDTLAAEPFLDISDRVGSSGNEQGLLGLAFPPDYGQRDYFFVNYTDRSGDTVISRFQIQDADRADPDSEFHVLSLQQPASNHNGGMLEFGPDGYLYVGTGDGGAANDRFGNGQNPDTLLGKMLRLDVTTDPAQPYQVPAGNPWIDQEWNGQAVRDEIWALGMRNPWRYSFDRATDDLWIADVGQNQYEEVHWVEQDRVAAGGLNFGWPIMEGTHCFPDDGQCDRSGLEIPVVDYDHSQGNCSITGGYVYRGQRYPVLEGVYFYGDYCSGLLWALWPDGAGGFQSQLMLQTGLFLSSFGEDEAGELYVTDLAGGSVYRLTAQ